MTVHYLSSLGFAVKDTNNRVKSQISSLISSFSAVSLSVYKLFLYIGLKRFTIISQQFHNERALYQAEHLGLDIEDLQAYNAMSPRAKRSVLIYIREYFARVKMFIDLATFKL